MVQLNNIVMMRSWHGSLSTLLAPGGGNLLFAGTLPSHKGQSMMTSSNGNILRVTDHLCGEFTGRRWIPRTKASDAELWCFLLSAPDKPLSKQSRGWWFEMPSRSLWRHCNACRVVTGCFCSFFINSLFFDIFLYMLGWVVLCTLNSSGFFNVHCLPGTLLLVWIYF